MLAYRRDSTFGVGYNCSLMAAHTYFGPNDIDGSWHGDRQK